MKKQEKNKIGTTEYIFNEQGETIDTLLLQIFENQLKLQKNSINTLK